MEKGIMKVWACLLKQASYCLRVEGFSQRDHFVVALAFR
jgi:hypothetical protein